MRTFHKTLPATLAVLLSLVLLPAASAAAAGPELLGSFGAFSSPQGVAVDQATGDVYVLDSGTQTIGRFNAEGTEVPFTATQPYIAGNQLTGTPGALPGEVTPFGFLEEKAQLAVDASGGPTQGELYATDASTEKVDVFAPEGSFLGEVNPALATPVSGGAPCGVAVGDSGDVYVAHYSGHVDEYEPTSANPAADVFLRQIATVESMCNIAVDSAGTVYGTPSEFGEVYKYPVAGALSKFAFPSFAIAVNTGDDHLFVVKGANIAQYGLSENPLGAPFGLLSSTALAVRASTDKLYAGDLRTGTVDIYQTGIPGPAGVSDQAALNVGSASAELVAAVNPNLGSTHYYFQYGTDTTYANGNAPNTTGIPVGEGEEPQQARVALTGLQPNTTYHYRLIAIRDSKGNPETTEGADQTFTTSHPSQPATSPAPQNPPVEASNAGLTPQQPTTYPNLTTFKPIPAAKEPAGKSKAKTKTKRCKKSHAKKHGKCVKQPKTKQTIHGKGSK